MKTLAKQSEAMDTVYSNTALLSKLSDAGMWASRAGLSIFGAVTSKDTGLGNMESIVWPQLFSTLCSHGYLSRGFCFNEAQASRDY